MYNFQELNWYFKYSDNAYKFWIAAVRLCTASSKYFQISLEMAHISLEYLYHWKECSMDFQLNYEKQKPDTTETW